MEFKRTLYHVQEPRIVIGDDVFGVDNYFWDDEVEADDGELQELVGRGFISPVKVVVDEEDVEEPAEDDESDEEDLSVLTRDTLLERLEEEGVTEDDIEGTGSDGYVKKGDALAKAREVL